MPGHDDQQDTHAHAHAHEEGHEEGHGPAIEDGGFFLEMVGIVVVDVVGELPGLEYIKAPYEKIKERFSAASDLKDTARDLRTRAINLETALGEMQVSLLDRDTSKNLCADIRKLVVELDKVIEKGRILSVAKHGKLKEDMNANETTFEILNRRYTSLQTRSELNVVREDIQDVSRQVQDVREVVEGIKKAQADQISVQNSWMARMENRIRSIDARAEGQGSSEVFASLSRMEEGIAGLRDALD